MPVGAHVCVLLVIADRCFDSSSFSASQSVRGIGLPGALVGLVWSMPVDMTAWAHAFFCGPLLEGLSLFWDFLGFPKTP